MDQLKDLFLPLTLANVSLTQLDLIIVQNWSLFFFFFSAGVSFRGPVTKMNLRQTMQPIRGEDEACDHQAGKHCWSGCEDVAVFAGNDL